MAVTYEVNLPRFTPEHRELYSAEIRFTHSATTRPAAPYDIQGYLGIVIGWLRRDPEDPTDLPAFSPVILTEQVPGCYSRIAEVPGGWEQIGGETYRTQVLLFTDRQTAADYLAREVASLEAKAQKLSEGVQSE